jgi:HNH endonuclease
MIGLFISLVVEATVLLIGLLLMVLRLMIRGSILLAVAIAGAVSRRRGGSRAGVTVARQPVDPSLRWAVFQRDGYACVHCGSTSDLTVDHIHPVSLGGIDDPSNLQTLCRSCNSTKGAS